MTFGVSIVTGTYGRIGLLKAMMQSVRAHLHSGIPLEFCICDGGSQDGTLEWLQTQSDVTLIADGELKGAVSAFTRAALLARYDYVCLVNDDVLFLDYSLLSAIAYLQEHPTCGAVAFSDDRPAQSKPDGYHVQTMTVLDLEGKPISIPYAQVGLYRRWLGDLCGWWGAYDPKFDSYTYGGDNYLTARIIEYGYTVDAVQGVKVKDIVAHDDLRAHNVRVETGKPSGYYQRFLTPPQMRDHPTVDNPERGPRLRILYLPIFESKSYPHHRSMKRGLREALQQRGEVVEIDYMNEDYNLLEFVTAWQPHILFLQVQRDLIDMTGVRAAQPEMLILNWNGDVYLDALISADTLRWLKANVDVQLVVNAASLPTYEREGIAAAYWQAAYEPVVGNITLSEEHTPDIVFMGSAYSDKRHELARLLVSLPYNLQLIGSGWVNYAENAGNTTYQFEISNAIRRAAKIEVGDNQYASDTGFVSNRIFDCLYAGGAILLHQAVDHLEDYTGFCEGVHYIAWHDDADLKKKIAYYMSPRHEAKRAKIVKAAYDYVRREHSFAARVTQLFSEILPKVL